MCECQPKILTAFICFQTRPFIGHFRTLDDGHKVAQTKKRRSTETHTQFTSFNFTPWKRPIFCDLNEYSCRVARYSVAVSHHGAPPSLALFWNNGTWFYKGSCSSPRRKKKPISVLQKRGPRKIRALYKEVWTAALLRTSTTKLS